MSGNLENGKMIGDYQIKHWVYYPNKKISIDKFFDEINKFLETHNVDSHNIIISDSSDYIFVYITYKVVKSKKSK